jgi:hypothetical protein
VLPKFWSVDIFSHRFNTMRQNVWGGPVQFLLTVFFAHNPFFFCRALETGRYAFFSKMRIFDDDSSSSSETRRTNSTMLCIAAD